MKMKTKILSGLLLCLMLNCMVWAEDSDYTFDDMDYSITAYNGTGGELILPNELGSCPVEIITSSVFYANTDVTSITFPDTLISLDGSNLYAMEQLQSVILPESLIAFDSYNLYCCPLVTEIDIPARVSYIGDYCFYSCDNLRTIRFYGEAPHIGMESFAYLPEDAVIYVPDDQLDAYETILPAGIQIQPSGENAVVYDFTEPEEVFDFDAETGTILMYNGFSARVDIPTSIGGVPVQEIGANAFSDNRYMYCVTVPEGVVSIGSEAFANTYHLSCAELPSTLKTIENNAFSSYRGSSITLPEGLTSIGNEAFYMSELSGSVYLPEGLTTIGNRAFHWSYINEVYFPSTIESIGEDAFVDSNVEYLYFEGKELPEISASAFQGLMISDVDLNWKASKEQMQAAQEFFDGIGQSARVWRMQNPNVDYIEDGLDVYENGVFMGYTGTQTHIRPWDHFEVTVTAIGDGALKGNTTIEYFAVPYSDEFTTIGAEAFAESSVKTVDLFDSVTTIGEGAFRDCTLIEEFVIPESVTSIGTGAFAGCTGLTKLVLPVAPDNFDASAFEGVDTFVMAIDDEATDEQVAAWNTMLNAPWYDQIDRVSEYKTLTKMPYEETNADDFWYDSEYMRLDNYDGYELNLYLPREISGVPMEMISANVLDSAKNTWGEVSLPVKSVVIPETAAELAYSVFSDCPDLEVVICYAPLENVPDEAFANCTGLREVVFVNGVRNIGMNAFVNCSALETVYLGRAVDQIDETAFDGSFDGFVTELPDIDAMLAAVKTAPLPSPTPVPALVIPELDIEAAAPYLGFWDGISMEIDGSSLDLKEFGMAVSLVFREDGRVEMSIGEDQGMLPWYVEDGIAYVQTGDTILASVVIDEQGMLHMDEQGTITIFRKGDSANAAVSAAASEPAAEAEAAQAVTETASGEGRMEQKYTCTQADVGGNMVAASTLGSEYAVTFHEDGTLDFIMAGVAVPGLTWVEEVVQTDSGENNVYAVEYFDGTELNFVLTETGFELNFFDAMLLYLEPHEK